MASSPGTSALDRARAKAYLRLLPILFVSYVIAYVDRVNVGFAKLKMQHDLAPLGFSEVGVRLRHGDLLRRLPGPGDPRHAHRREAGVHGKWISRIMISWGIVAAMTAFVHYRVPGVTWLAESTVARTGSSFRAAGEFQSGLAVARSPSDRRVAASSGQRVSSCSSSRYGSCSGWPRRVSIRA